METTKSLKKSAFFYDDEFAFSCFWDAIAQLNALYYIFFCILHLPNVEVLRCAQIHMQFGPEMRNLKGTKIKLKIIRFLLGFCFCFS